MGQEYHPLEGRSAQDTNRLEALRRAGNVQLLFLHTLELFEFFCLFVVFYKIRRPFV